MIYTASDGSRWDIEPAMAGWWASDGHVQFLGYRTTAACVAAIEEHVRKEKKESADADQG